MQQLIYILLVGSIHWTTLFEYKFHEDIGQAIIDHSGNDYTLVNGISHENTTDDMI